MVGAFSQARYEFLPLAMLVYLASRMVNAWEWQLLLVKVGQPPLLGLFGILLIGTLVNAVLPANLGDVAKIQIAANRYSLPRVGVIAGRAAEAVMNSLVFVFFVMVSVAIVPGGASNRVMWILAGITAAFSIAAVLGGRCIPASAPSPVMERLPRSMAVTLAGHWPRIHDGLEVIRRPRLLGWLLIINAFGWAVDILIAWSYGSTFNLAVPFSAYISITVVLALISTVPITFGNIGMWEFGIVGILALYSVPADQALAYAVGTHVLITVFNIGFGLIAMIIMGLKPQELYSLGRTPAQA